MTTTVLAANPVSLVPQPDSAHFPVSFAANTENPVHPMQNPEVPHSQNSLQSPELSAPIPEYTAPPSDSSFQYPIPLPAQIKNELQYPVPVAPLPPSIYSENSPSLPLSLHSVTSLQFQSPLGSLPSAPHTECPSYPIPVPASLHNDGIPSIPSTLTPSSPSIFGSHPSAFVPYVSANSVDSPSSPTSCALTSPEHVASSNPASSQSSPEKKVSPLDPPSDSILDLEFVHHYEKPSILDSSYTEDALQQSPPPTHRASGRLDNEPAAFEPSPLSRLLDNTPLFIPAASNVTAPVQMFSGRRLVPGTARLASTVQPSNNNDETVSAASALSQYFNASYQNQVLSRLST